MANIVGDNTAETIDGTTNDDTIDARGGNDIINLSLGHDQIDGNTGTDTIRYVTAAGDSLQIHTGNGTYQIQGASGLHDGTFTRVERINVTGGTLADYVWGGAQADTIRGGAGDDYLSGGGGGDSIVGGTGNDFICRNYYADPFLPIFDPFTASAATIDGGIGTDQVWIDLSANSANRTFNLGQAASTLVLDGGLTLKSIEYFGLFRTGAGADTVTLGTAHGQVETGGGNDTVIVDTTGLSDDYTHNTNYLDGGANDDILVVDGSAVSSGGYVIANLGNISMSDGAFSLGSSGIVNFEHIDATGGAGGDLLSGGGSSDTLVGGLGNDTLESNGGNDSLDGGDGDDTFRYIFAGTLSVAGGVGTDRASIDYSSINTGHTVDLSLAAGTLVLFGGATLTSIEGFDGFRTGSGMDDIEGTGLYDDIDSGAGNDTLRASSGGDYLVGGNGIDTLVFDFGTLSAAQPVFGSVGFLAFGSDYVSTSGIEILHATAGAGDDAIDGGNNADTLRGRAGNDTLNGGGGNDTIDGGDGADQLNGGGGTGDWVGYADSSAAVTVRLMTGTATGSSQGTGDTLSGFEHVTGSGYADKLYGNGLGNRLSGDAGTDQLFGGGGADTLNGGAGNDRLTGNAGADIFEFTIGGFGADTILGFEDGVDHLDLRSLGLTFADFTLGENSSGDAVLTSIAAPSNKITFKGIDQSAIGIDDFL